MASIACHYIARAARLSLLPHQPASTIQANSNPSQITVQLLSAAPAPKQDAVSFWAPVRKAYPVPGQYSGMQFPQPTPFGKRIPLFG